MKVYVTIEVTKTEGKRQDFEDIAAELESEIDGLDLYVDETQYELSTVAVRQKKDELP